MVKKHRLVAGILILLSIFTGILYASCAAHGVSFWLLVAWMLTVLAVLAFAGVGAWFIISSFLK